MYEIEEEVIDRLEEIDITFSKINNGLRSIKTKIEKQKGLNDEILKDFSKYFELFDIKKKAEIQELTFDIDATLDQSLSLDGIPSVSNNVHKQKLGDEFRPKSYKSFEYNDYFQDTNPFDSSMQKEVCFEDNNSPSTLEQSKTLEFPTSIQNEANSAQDLKKMKHNESKLFNDLSSSLEDIEDLDLPNVFKNDVNFFKVYNFIKDGQNVKYQDVLDKFDNIDHDTLEIYVQLFISKHLIRWKNGVFISK